MLSSCARCLYPNPPGPGARDTEEHQVLNRITIKANDKEHNGEQEDTHKVESIKYREVVHGDDVVEMVVLC